MRGAIIALLATVAVSAAASERTDRFGLNTQAAAVYVDSVYRDRQLRIPMRDGVRLNADVWFPKGERKNLPVILIRTPYEMSVESAKWMTAMAEWLKEGYAIMISQERGRHWSEGSYAFLAGAGEDGFDTIDWIIKQPWSNGKVGTIGCSSSAENQMGLAAMGHPAHAAMIPCSPNAGIGFIGPFHEQGNWYRGGVNQIWLDWYYESAFKIRPSFPTSLSQVERIQVEELFNISPALPRINFARAVWHLPIQDMMRAINALPSDFDEFIRRKPGDPAWAKTAFGNEGDRFATPSLWILSWYDYAIAPDITFANWQRDHGRTEEARDNQFVIIGPTTHCGQGYETVNTIVGERELGDARYDYLGVFTAWFNHWLKGQANSVAERPKVALFTMGKGWQGYEAFPPPSAAPTTYYLSSSGHANSLAGDGVLTRIRKGGQSADSYVYDPVQPVPSHGGGSCCFGDDLVGGAFDQTDVELRHDVLVYTSAPLEEGIEVTGFIDVVLYISSDVKDTDFAVKLVDVLPDGRAFNLADSIQRARYRNGYDREVFMRTGEIYKVLVGPFATSAFFDKGHRIRLEVTSSNFPRYLRNLNTGGNNYDEAQGVIAHTVVHHDAGHPSQIVLPVVRQRSAP